MKILTFLNLSNTGKLRLYSSIDAEELLTITIIDNNYQCMRLVSCIEYRYILLTINIASYFMPLTHSNTQHNIGT